jgi:Acyl-CoA thioesterase C-terminal domain/Acyl-CoA thioesterase N-terminal domain
MSSATPVAPDPVEASLYRRDGARFVPTAFTTGPWRADAMHGGAPGALIGVLASSAVEEGELLARVQVDLERPVPLMPVVGTVERRQVSNRIAHLDMQLATEGGERVVGARALAMRTTEVAAATPAPSDAAHPEAFPLMNWDTLYPPGQITFVRDATEHRIVRGGYGVAEPSAAWLRLVVPVVEGETSGGLAELLAVADFGSPLSISGSVGEGLALINADVNVTVSREPSGPWFRLEAASRVGTGGVGVVVAQIHDREGPLGVITQSQIVRRYLGPTSAR